MSTKLVPEIGNRIPYINETVINPTLKKDCIDMEFRPIMCNTLSEEDRLKAKKELNETEENVRKGLQRLRDFLKSQDLPSRTDDDFLLLFLRAHKFNFKKSEQKLKKYLDMRQEVYDLVESIDLDKTRDVVDSMIVGLLPYRDKHGRCIIFTRGTAYDPETTDIEAAVKCFLAMFHFVASFLPTAINGLCYIPEAGFSSNFHYYLIFPIYTKYIMYQTAFPCRIQRVDVIKENWICHYLYKTFRPILPKKITRRVELHGSNLEELQKAYHPSILPDEFGGTMGPLSNEFYRDIFLEYVKQFKAENAYFKRKSKISYS